MSANDLQGIRVLLVEDQMIVAMQIEDMLRAAGCEVVGPLASVHAAITLAREKALDLAVLDINLDSEKVYPAAEALQARGIPFIFATGYGESTLPEKWRDHPRLSKPFRREQLEQLLRNVAGRARSHLSDVCLAVCVGVQLRANSHGTLPFRTNSLFGAVEMTALTGKVAIVTGASSGIGRATALLFASEGAKLVVTARRKSQLDELIAEIERAGGKAVAVAGDVRDEALAKELVDTAMHRFGGLDVAFNNAGSIGKMGPTADVTLAAWQDTLDTNLTSAFLGAKYQVPAMIARGGGSLIFTSSFVGYTVGMPGMAAYAASKAGLIGLTQVLAAEFGAKGIRANAILPGGTDTPASITNAPDATPEVLAFVENLHALKRMARPEEIARSVLHLASDASSFITGTALLVDGGVSISRT